MMLRGRQAEEGGRQRSESGSRKTASPRAGAGKDQAWGLGFILHVVESPHRGLGKVSGILLSSPGALSADTACLPPHGHCPSAIV